MIDKLSPEADGMRTAIAVLGDSMKATRSISFTTVTITFNTREGVSRFDTLAGEYEEADKLYSDYLNGDTEMSDAQSRELHTEIVRILSAVNSLLNELAKEGLATIAIEVNGITGVF